MKQSNQINYKSSKNSLKILLPLKLYSPSTNYYSPFFIEMAKGASPHSPSL